MAINTWWHDDPDEIYWMEVTHDPETVGQRLISPKREEPGTARWTYEMTSHVQPGDRVFHWLKPKKGQPSLVGWSIAVGPLQTFPSFSWKAKGTRGRARSEPTVGDAWLMPLAEFTLLDQPITRADVIGRRREIVQTMREVAQRVGRPTYPPFSPHGARDLRASQAYLTKFPAALVDLLLRRADQISGTERSDAPKPEPAQGYMSDAVKRAAIERHAVDAAIKHYRRQGASDVEELGKPYDLRVWLDGKERHVEVKGSVGLSVGAVQLTQGEVEHARRHQPTDLFVVDEIVAEVTAGGEIRTSGGRERLWASWSPDDRSLRPTHLHYTLPK
ncbi:protein NO VEIN domain-containing protein [Pseudoclavibacter sp. RFBG4]|uniref:protein NO VEIN domain-containing protein n=1 Tax=Pseudoclavibacter sp. RFBG4 TaxID=2080575 RepID=UPI0015E2B07C|nr:DUF3883 domain-containing protein [Pseudoclavibacter sp. RFBG4]